MNVTYDKKVNIYVFFIILFFYSLFYWINWRSPGVYQDAVNPDYLAAFFLNKHNYITTWLYPDNLLYPDYRYPLLNSLYGGNISAYLATPFFKVLGFNLFSIRFYHYILGLFTYCICYCFLIKSDKRNIYILIGFFILFFDFNYIYSWRTQYYLQLFPSAFCLGSLILFIDYIKNKHKIFKLILSSVLMGFSAYCYFLYFFIALAIFLCIFLCYRKRLGYKNILYMIFFFLIGYFPFIYAHFSIFYQAGFDNYVMMIKGLQNSYGVIDQDGSLFKNFYVVINKLSLLFSGNGVWYSVVGVDEKSLISDILFYFQITYTLLSFIIVLLYCVILICELKINNKNLNVSDFIDFVSLFVIFVLFLLYVFIGKSLSMQHYIVIIPFLVCIIVSATEKTITKIQNWNSRYKLIINIAIFSIILLNIINLYNMNTAIAKNGGNGYYSDVINKTSKVLELYPEGHTFVILEWGYNLSLTTLLGHQYNIIGLSNPKEYFDNIEQYPKSVNRHSYTILFGKVFMTENKDIICEKLNNFLKEHDLVKSKVQFVIGTNNKDSILIVDINE